MENKFDIIRDLIKDCQTIMDYIEKSDPINDDFTQKHILTVIKVAKSIIEDQKDYLINADHLDDEKRKDNVITLLNTSKKNLENWKKIFDDEKGKDDSFSVDEKKKTVSKAKPDEGKMHKILGVKPGEKIADKYKSGEELFNSLSKRLKDNGKVVKMIAYAANISKEKDIFDAALRFAKEHKTKKDA